MIMVERSVIINKSVAVVFACVSGSTNDPKWKAGVDSVILEGSANAFGRCGDIGGRDISGHCRCAYRRELTDSYDLCARVVTTATLSENIPIAYRDLFPLDA